MPGGSRQAWQHVQPVFEAISAKAPSGEPCCGYIGENGAGHFVKMVHNGIEYGDIQIICEAYQVMRDLLAMPASEIGDVFAQWNQSELNSYLIEITANILHKLGEDGLPIVDKILDTAGQKGTGKWTGICALEEGIPLTLIGEAVFARCLSAQKEERIAASARFPISRHVFSGDKQALIEDLRQAVYASKIVSYAQGFALIRQACRTYDWQIDCGQVAMIWREGCIIRSVFWKRYGKPMKSRKIWLICSWIPILPSVLWQLSRGGDEQQHRPFYRVFRCRQLLLPSVILTDIAAAIFRPICFRHKEIILAHIPMSASIGRGGEFFHTDWTGHGRQYFGIYLFSL